MNRKRILTILAIVMSTVLVVAGLVTATSVFADEPAAPFVPFGQRGGGLSRGGFAFAGGSMWTMFDEAADALGMTPVELFTELRAGKNLVEIAEEQGIDMEVVEDALSAARDEARAQAIEKAVEDGSMSQEQADWMREGRDKGFLPRDREVGFGRGQRGRHPFMGKRPADQQ